MQPADLAAVNVTDARKSRKAVFRRTIDYNASTVNYLKDRLWVNRPTDRRALQPDYLWSPKLCPPKIYTDCPMNCVMSKPVRTSTNKNKCPIYCVCWTPEGRRLITGAFSGEFTLWNGLTFNFETILQAHESQIRCMKWSHNEEWLLTADHSGYVKYWQANMNNVEMYQAHKEPIRGVRYAYAHLDDSCNLRNPVTHLTELAHFLHASWLCYTKLRLVALTALYSMAADWFSLKYSGSSEFLST
ncbi:WD repeat-containing protein 33, variant 2, partial [Clonorchis sinensis]